MFILAHWMDTFQIGLATRRGLWWAAHLASGWCWYGPQCWCCTSGCSRACCWVWWWSQTWRILSTPSRLHIQYLDIYLYILKTLTFRIWLKVTKFLLDVMQLIEVNFKQLFFWIYVQTSNGTISCILPVQPLHFGVT